MSQYIYLIESPRPELVSDPDAWTEDEIGIVESHFA